MIGRPVQIKRPSTSKRVFNLTRTELEIRTHPTGGFGWEPTPQAKAGLEAPHNTPQAPELCQKKKQAKVKTLKQARAGLEPPVAPSSGAAAASLIAAEHEKLVARSLPRIS